jgi:hypothetical protein
MDHHFESGQTPASSRDAREIKECVMATRANIQSLQRACEDISAGLWQARRDAESSKNLAKILLVVCALTLIISILK